MLSDFHAPSDFSSSFARGVLGSRCSMVIGVTAELVLASECLPDKEHSQLERKEEEPCHRFLGHCLCRMLAMYTVPSLSRLLEN